MVQGSNPCAGTPQPPENKWEPQPTDYGSRGGKCELWSLALSPAADKCYLTASGRQARRLKPTEHRRTAHGSAPEVIRLTARRVHNDRDGCRLSPHPTGRGRSRGGGYVQAQARDGG